MPASENVGTLGIAVSRWGALTASSVSLSTLPASGGTVAIITCTWPPSTAVMACPPL